MPLFTIFLLCLASSPAFSKELTVTLPGGETMEMVWIAPGTFRMGSPPAEPRRRENEGPMQAKVISKGFFLGKYEVTQAQWISVMEWRPWLGKDKKYVQEGPEIPAVCISWTDAQQFIDRMNAAEGTPVYRLPKRRSGSMLPGQEPRPDGHSGKTKDCSDSTPGISHPPTVRARTVRRKSG